MVQITPHEREDGKGLSLILLNQSKNKKIMKEGEIKIRSVVKMPKGAQYNKTKFLRIMHDLNCDKTIRSCSTYDMIILERSCDVDDKIEQIVDAVKEIRYGVNLIKNIKSCS